MNAGGKQQGGTVNAGGEQQGGTANAGGVDIKAADRAEKKRLP